jgi:hypothetical protein
LLQPRDVNVDVCIRNFSQTRLGANISAVRAYTQT